MHRIHVLFLFAALVMPVADAAENIEYAYLDGVVASREGPRDDFEGAGVRASIPLGPSFFAAAELHALGVDGLDRTDMLIGAGYHLPLNRHADVIARLDYVSVDTDIADDAGLRVGGGIRSMVARQLEVRGMLQYADVGDGDFVVELAAQYLVDDAWAAFLAVSDGGDLGGTTLGARWHF